MTTLVTNNATTTLSASITTAATTINLSPGTGALFPNPTAGQYFWATLSNLGGNIEIVKVTNRSTDSLTVVRAQDNTSALAWNAGDKFDLRPCAALFNDKLDITTASATYLPLAGGTLTGQLTTATTGLQFSDGSQQVSAPSGKNLIVDGNFDQWTASSAAASLGAYGPATMYRSSQGTGGAATISQTAFAVGGEPAAMTSPVVNYYSHQQTTAATSTAPFIQQFVEGVRTLNGRSATFSCWLWCASGTVTISNIIARQNFGTGGSPSASVTIDTAVNWTVTTTPQRFSVRVDFPSISGKTIGTGGNDYLQIGLWFPSGSTYTVNTAQWQLERCSPQAGSAGLPTAFEYRGIGPELQRVQRFYEFMNAAVYYGDGNSGNVLQYTFQFSTTKRAAPTCAPVSGWSTGSCTASIAGTTPSAMLVNATLSATGVFSFAASGGVTADARL